MTDFNLGMGVVIKAENDWRGNVGIKLQAVASLGEEGADRRGGHPGRGEGRGGRGDARMK